MLEPQNKIKNIVSSIVSPFATASMILLIVLSFLEYFRRGFVSLFLDFRIIVAIVLILWGIAVLTEDPPRRRRLASVLPTLALLAVLPVLYKMTLPFGRLGLITFVCAMAVLLLVSIAIIPKSTTNNS